jgi:hypothetical protein
MPDAEPDICGATTRSGTPCQRKAGWGTDHVGSGRCRAHGGNAGRPPTHGLYSKTAREGLAAKIREAREHDTQELRDEVAVLRALLTDYLEDVHTVDEDTVSDITKLVDAVRRGADTLSKIDARTALTARHVEYLQARFADILTTYVPDEDVDAALRDLRDAVAADEPSALDI